MFAAGLEPATVAGEDSKSSAFAASPREQNPSFEHNLEA